LAVLGDIQKTADVNPTRTTFTLPNELVEGTVVENPEEPVVTGLEIWKADVRSFAKKVLGVGDTTYKAIQFGTTVAGGDNHRNINVLAEGFKNLNAEIPEVGN